MSRAPIVLAAVLVAAGIALGLQRPVPIGGGPLAFLLAIGGGGLALLAMAGGRFRPLALAILLTAGGAILGAVAGAQERRRCSVVIPPELTVTVRGVVESVAPPRLRLRLTDAGVSGARLSCDETVPARSPPTAGPSPAAGDLVTARGRWWRPPGAQSGGVLMLDSIAPADARGGDGALGDGALQDGRGRTGNRLARTRGGAARRLESMYGERAGLATSLLIAQRDGLDRDVRDRFARAGLSHLLAISGLHVGLVAGLLLLLGKVARLRGRVAAGIAALGTVAYVLFLGAPAAASRAALQVVFLLAAATLQRPARSEALVATAALVLLMVEPASLGDPGFQLSFAGVIGLIALRRPLLDRLKRLAEWRVAGVRVGRWLADGLATGAAATLATAPIVAWHFGRVALIGIAANLAAIPLVGALVPTLALSLAAHAIAPPVGDFLAGAGGLLLGALDTVARLAAAVPGGSVPVAPAAAALWTGAAGAAFLASRRLGRVRPAVRALVAAGAAAVVVVGSAVRLHSDRLEVHVIDVGQGDAIALRTPAGRWLLVDAGIGGAGYDAGERRVVPYLGLRGVRRLEGLVLTHPDADHIGGATAVVRALRPRWVGDPGIDVGKPGYLELLEAATSSGIPWVRLAEGLELELDGVTVEFLHPRPAVVGGPAAAVADANDASVVLRVAYGEFSALLTGDAPAFVEEDLVQRFGAALEAEVLKAGHHGSRTSTSGALLGATGARIALISSGRGNRYGHPHRTVLARLDSAGVQVLRTDRDGTIVVSGGSGGSIRVERERERENR